MADRFGYLPGARCGWCIDADHGVAGVSHDQCVVVVECNAVRPNTVRDGRKAGPYFWLCKCESPSCVKDPYCIDCRRRGTELAEWRCVNRRSCGKAREHRLKKLKEKANGKGVAA